MHLAQLCTVYASGVCQNNT